MTPPELGAIARVIDPDAWSLGHLADALATCLKQTDKDETVRGYAIAREESLVKAGAILALLPAPRAGEDVVEQAFKFFCENLNDTKPCATCGNKGNNGPDYCQDCDGTGFVSKFKEDVDAFKDALSRASLLRQSEAVPNFRDDLLMQTVMRAYDSYVGKSHVELARAITDAVLALIERTRAPEAAPGWPQVELLRLTEGLHTETDRTLETVRHYIHMHLGKPVNPLLPSAIETSLDTTKSFLIEKIEAIIELLSAAPRQQLVDKICTCGARRTPPHIGLHKEGCPFAAPSVDSGVSEERLGDWQVEELAQEICRICEPDRHQDSAVRQIKVEAAIATWLKRYVTLSPNPDARNRALEEAIGIAKEQAQLSNSYGERNACVQIIEQLRALTKSPPAEGETK